MDLGDRYSQLYVVDPAGEEVATARVGATPAGLEQWFGARAPVRVVLEAGTHSPWASRLLTTLGHEVLVANPIDLRE
jgi:transposase